MECAYESSNACHEEQLMEEGTAKERTATELQLDVHMRHVDKQAIE